MEQDPFRSYGQATRGRKRRRSHFGRMRRRKDTQRRGRVLTLTLSHVWSHDVQNEVVTTNWRWVRNQMAAQWSCTAMTSISLLASYPHPIPPPPMTRLPQWTFLAAVRAAFAARRTRYRTRCSRGRWGRQPMRTRRRRGPCRNSSQGVAAWGCGSSGAATRDAGGMDTVDADEGEVRTEGVGERGERGGGRKSEIVSDLCGRPRPVLSPGRLRRDARPPRLKCNVISTWVISDGRFSSLSSATSAWSPWSLRFQGSPCCCCAVPAPSVARF